MKYINTVFLLSFVFIFASCKTLGSIQISDNHGPAHQASESHVSEQHMPPAHAPAHGRRVHAAKRQYYYYPDSYVYFDTQRNVYFYLSGTNWVVSASLPGHYQLDNYRVSLSMDSAKPYSKHKHHKKKYPKKHKNKSKGKKKKNKHH